MSDGTCIIEGCDSKHVARGWCGMHYQRWRRHGDPLAERIKPDPVTCSVDGCEQTASKTKMCRMHYDRWREHGDPGPAERLCSPKGVRTPCSIEGCERSARYRGWCEAHYSRWQRLGDPGDARIQQRNPGAVCSVYGCERGARARGWCKPHYDRWLKHGDPGVARIEPRKTDDIGYDAAHYRVYAIRGSASGYVCTDCGTVQAQDWAYDHCDPDEQVAPAKGETHSGLSYSVNPERYIPLCKKCHKAFDLGRDTPTVSFMDNPRLAM